MIKLGKLTDYAIAVMGQLAKEGQDVSCSAHYLSEKTGIAEPTVAKVLKTLSKGSLITSIRGAAGGYRLSKPASQITLAEVVRALDGPIKIVSCVDGGEMSCKTQATCPVKGGWDKVNQAIVAALESVHIAEMAPASCDKATVHMRGMQ